MPEEIYRLKFTPKASEDLEQIYSYISQKLFVEVAANNFCGVKIRLDLLKYTKTVIKITH